MNASRNLEDLRRAIDDTDTELLELLNRRARLALEVGAAKAEKSDTTYYVPERERSIIDRLRHDNGGPFPDSAIRPVFQEVISACLSMQAGIRVAFLGPEATYTEQAVKRHFGSAADGMVCGSIPGVFDAVEREVVEFGVIPFENSTEGFVTHSLDSFVGSSLSICAEVLIGIEHCLLARREQKMENIVRIYSHPQAFAQCRRWLAANLPNATLVETSSTAEAARAAREDVAGGAIAAELAARAYGLDVIREAIQDQKDNTTRFLVVGRNTATPKPTGDDKTTLLFVLRDSAGALYRAIKPLADAGVNMTRIESRPSRKKAWRYVFFIDVDGHREDEQLSQALTAMRAECQRVDVLGSYRRADPL